MDPKEKLDLKRLVQHHDDYQDNTEGIRRLKHSDLIQAEILKMEALKKEHKDLRENQYSLFEEKCRELCSFLYTAYTDIFNRLIKDELDLDLMIQAISTLKKIENGEIDQQEGSVLMGKLLHKVFVESALKRGEALEEEHKTEEIPKQSGKDISWKDYKKSNRMS